MENTMSSHSLMHSFCVRPNARFESQMSGEEIILLVRAHPITQLPWIINGILLFILVILLNILFSSVLTSTQRIFVNLGAVVFILSYYWIKFLTYFFNAGIVTNNRVIDVDFSAVIYKEVTETRLSNVEDITAKSGGYFASLFNFGDVYVQTAGTHENIEFLNIPRPSDVVRIINEVLKK